MDSNEIVIASLGIVATCVGALIWIAKYLLKQFKHSLDRNAAANEKIAAGQEKVAKATKQNTAVNKETLEFMRNLNGQLKAAAQAKLEGK